MIHQNFSWWLVFPQAICDKICASQIASSCNPIFWQLKINNYLKSPPKKASSKKKAPDLWDRKHFILLHPKHMKQIDSVYTLIAKSVEKQKKSLGAKKSSHFIGEGFSLYTSKNMRQKGRFGWIFIWYFATSKSNVQVGWLVLLQAPEQNTWQSVRNLWHSAMNFKSKTVSFFSIFGVLNWNHFSKKCVTSPVPGWICQSWALRLLL